MRLHFFEMNSILAQYLFNKEIIYKNPPSQVASEKETVVDKKEEIARVASNVPPPTPTLVEEVQAQPSFNPAALKLRHQVLVITDSISDDEKVFLSKILGAVGLSLSQIDLLEIQQAHPIDYSSFITQKTTTKFISFGVGLSKLNWDLLLVPYQIRNVSGIDFLLSNDLGAISTDTNHKKSLWAALQLMFGK